MAKKRKASSHAGQSSSSRQDEPTHLTINSFEDVADSADEFELAQDRVLLDPASSGQAPPGSKRRRKDDEAAFLELSDDDIGPAGLAPSDSESELDEEDDDDDDDMPLESSTLTRADKKRLRENLGGPGEESSDDDDEHSDGDAVAAWGSSRAALYGADAAATEEDATAELAEASRLRKRQVQGFGVAGFELDEAEWRGSAEDDAAAVEKAQQDGLAAKETATVVLSTANITVPPETTMEETCKLLHSRFPEFALLATELSKVDQDVEELSKLAASTSDPVAAGLVATQLRAGRTYAAALAVYFAVLTAPAVETPPSADGIRTVARGPGEMHSHPVMTELVRSRDTWHQLRHLVAEMDESEEESSDDEFEIEADSESGASDTETSITVSNTRRTKSESKALKAAREAAEARSSRVLDTLSSLDSALQKRSSKPSTKVHSSIRSRMELDEDGESDDSDRGDPDQLSRQQMDEKVARRRSVRFHMSQIDQREAKRAGATQMDGDDDVPHRERWRDRVERLNKEAEARGRKPASAGEALGSDDGEDENVGGRAGDDDVDEDGYYDMIAARSAAKKASKKAAAETAVALAAAPAGTIPIESIGEDGKRAITYQIAKNKGLSASESRRKSVKNPRVKKRMKYETKMKRLKSTKAVYDAATASKQRGGVYSGEMTGIKPGLVRSRKL